MKVNVKKVTLKFSLLLILMTTLSLSMLNTSCTRIEEEDISSDQEPTPQLSQTPSQNLIQHMVSHIGDEIETSLIQRYASRDMQNVGGAEPYMIESVQNSGNFWLVPLKNNVTTDGLRITYKVRPSLKTFYEGADFVMVATLEDANHPYSIGVRLASQNACKNGVCASQVAIVDAGAVSPGDLCTGSVTCSSSGQSNSSEKFCMVKNCFAGACKSTILRIPSYDPCPGNTCMSSSDCSNDNDKTCYYKKCEQVGIQKWCNTVSTTVPASSPCPGDECTNNESCNESGGTGGIGTIMETLGY